MSIDLKQQVAQRFSQAAHEYDQYTPVQSDILADALSLLPNQLGVTLEVGVGTGTSLPRLQRCSSQLLAIDIAPGMLKLAARKANQRAALVCADAESLPFAANQFDWVFSSMALQWVSSVEQFSTELARVMKPCGQAMLAIMVAGSFPQWQQCWQTPEHHMAQFANSLQWQNALQACGLQVSFDEREYTAWHDSLKHMFASIRRIGANNSTSSHKYLSRSELRRFENRYQAFRDTSGRFPLTYKVAFFHISRQ